MTSGKYLSLTFFLLLFTSAAFAQKDAPLKITPLNEDFYVHTTYRTYEGALVSSNSMYLVTSEGVVMFDSPWDTTQFQPLLDSIEARHNKKVIICIATHSHEDRTGAFDFLKEKGVKTYVSEKTNELSRQNNAKIAEYSFKNDTTFNVGEYSFQTYFPGEGHTKDNIVIWFEKDRIIYGGCLVKSTEATDLGYTKEGNLSEWPTSIKNLKRKFPKPNFIITGHQDWKSKESLDHTLKLLAENKKATKSEN